MAIILIVDDRPINRQALSMLLGDEGYHVLEAEHGIQALEVIQNILPDLIITDILMPKMDGLTLVKTLQTDPIFKKIPIIFYSATYQAAEAFRLANANKVEYVLTKPCDPQVILNTIQSALKTHVQIQGDPIIKSGKHITTEKIDKLEIANLRLTSLIEIGLDMSVEHDVERLMYVTCKGGRQFLDACYAGVMIKDSENENLYKVLTLTKENKKNLQTVDSSDVCGLLKEVFYGENPICIHSPILDLEKLALADICLPITSFLSIPLKNAKERYGHIYFINKFNNKYFDPSDQRFMLTLANKFSIHHENINLYKQIEKHKNQLEKEMLQRKEFQELVFRQKYHLELAEIQRVNLMGEMATTLAHELNQPLTAILTYTQTCVRKLKSEKWVDQQVLQAMESVAQQAERAGTIIHRMKNFVRKGNLSLESLSINEILLNLSPHTQYEGDDMGVAMDFRLAESLPPVYVDRIQIEQVVLNLFRNAIEAMKEDKTDSPQIILKSYITQDNRVAVSLTDNGPGFSDYLVDTIFNPYVTTKATGTGMGLAISRTIIEAHGGQLSAHSIPRKGACFEFTLPIK